MVASYGGVEPPVDESCTTECVGPALISIPPRSAGAQFFFCMRGKRRFLCEQFLSAMTFQMLSRSRAIMFFNFWKRI